MDAVLWGLGKELHPSAEGFIFIFAQTFRLQCSSPRRGGLQGFRGGFRLQGGYFRMFRHQQRQNNNRQPEDPEPEGGFRLITLLHNCNGFNREIDLIRDQQHPNKMNGYPLLDSRRYHHMQVWTSLFSPIFLSSSTFLRWMQSFFQDVWVLV